MTALNPAISAAKYDMFFTELALDGNVTRACKVAGVDRRSAYQMRDKPEFEARWQNALEEACDKLEAEARRRAVEGYEKGVWHQGVMVGVEKQYSDSLLALMLKGNRSKYRDGGRLELANAPGETFAVSESPTQVARRIAFVFASAMQALGNQQPATDQDDGGDLA